MLSLKQKLLAAYRKEVAAPSPSTKLLQRMLDMCKEMYNVLEIVEPGISRLKGTFIRILKKKIFKHVAGLISLYLYNYLYH